MKPFFVNSSCVYQESEILSIIISEIKTNKTFPSQKLKTQIENYPRADRARLVRKCLNGVCPLFCAALHGNTMAAEYLVSIAQKFKYFRFNKLFILRFLAAMQISSRKIYSRWRRRRHFIMRHHSGLQLSQTI